MPKFLFLIFFFFFFRFMKNFIWLSIIKYYLFDFLSSGKLKQKKHVVFITFRDLPNIFKSENCSPTIWLEYNETENGIGWLDREVLQELVPWKETIDGVSQTEVGTTNVFLDGSRLSCRMKECNIGNFITDAFVDQVRWLFLYRYPSSNPLGPALLFSKYLLLLSI